MSSDISDNESIFGDHENLLHDSQTGKTKRKPGRKPNPASPALRKAQNRAAQRAFRERKEKHTRELEVAIKQIKEQRDRYYAENEQLKADHEIIRSENWYLKGVVLALQLVCFQHKINIPQHGPYINEETLSEAAQVIPDSISTYIDINSNNKPPIPSKLFNFKHSTKYRDRYLSTGSIIITKDGIHNVPDKSNIPSQPAYLSKPDFLSNQTGLHKGIGHSDIPTKRNIMEIQERDEEDTMPALSPIPESITAIEDQATRQIPVAIPVVPHTSKVTEEPLTSNLAAIQTLRLRLILQSACMSMDSIPFAIRPTLLQLTIPHDPRIDLVPIPHMRDRMILFRDLFNLDDCFRCLLQNSAFREGDPTITSNWKLPSDFFRKYWYLTIDYKTVRGYESEDTTSLEPKTTSFSSTDFSKMAEQIDSAIEAVSAACMAAKKGPKENQTNSPCSDSDTPSWESSPNLLNDVVMSSFEPVLLTSGTSFSYPTRKATMSSRKQLQRQHPYKMKDKLAQSPSKIIKLMPSDVSPWDTLSNNTATPSQQNYDEFILDTL